jgi:parallel beta-helix repeat protein
MMSCFCGPGAGRWSALVLALGFGTLRAGAATYFVASNGSDTNSGTSLAAPFQTIQHAAATTLAGDICYIRAGVYHEMLTPSHSGTSSAPITFAAYSNEVVTLDGADVVTGWTLLSNCIYQAPVNWDLGEGHDQVFVDGTMIHQAQYPDYGDGDVLHPATVSVTVDSSNTNLITSTAWSGQPDDYWAGAWFLGEVGYSWAWQSARVLSSTGSTITVDPATETFDWWFTGNGVGFLWGNFGFLHADNEWYVQRNSGGNTLYLRITGGGNPSTHTVEMKRRNWCVDLNNLNYITVSGLNLWAGAVLLQGNGNVLQNCQAQFLSHFMIISRGYYEDGGAEQGGGVAVNGNNNIVRGCTLFNTAGTGVYVYGGDSNLITRNVIYNTDYSGTYACAIALHGSGDIVTFNTAHTSGRDILRPEGTGSDIRFNDLSEPRLLCLDLGVIYVWGIDGQGASGPATRIAYNWIHDNDYPLPCALIYLDNYDWNFVVDHNVCWNTGGDSGIRINGPAYGLLIYNNTLFNCADVGAYTYDSWPSSNPDPAFWTNDVYQYSASNNLYLANSPQTQLVNWTNDDFSLLPYAPAINAGVVIPGFTDGYMGSAPDLGAYKFGSPAWNAGVVSQPTLAITSTGAGILTLTASPDAAYYVLYSSTNLTPSALWNPVTNRPFVSGDQWFVTLSIATNVSSYYRLQSQ